MVFIGKIPAPPAPESLGGLSNVPTQLCAKLVSRADDCTSGQPGSEDRMRFTISECVDQDLPGAPPKILDSEPNEGKFINIFTVTIRYFNYHKEREKRLS